MRLILICTAVLALAACKPSDDFDGRTIPAEEAGTHKAVDRSHKGQPFPNVTFLDEEDTPMSYSPLLGQPTLVNLWATWCAPCVKELPTLDRLSKLKSAGVYVAPISEDEAPRASVEAFFTDHKLNLPMYRDPKSSLSAALGPDTVLPTTILYDANGKEVWRYVGDLDWTSPQAAKLLAEAGVASKKG